MLTEICQYLKNWFDRGQPKFFGDFTVASGKVSTDGKEIGFQTGQYYRIVGSLFNDGVHKYTGEADAELVDESFNGAVWSMAVPPAVISLAEEIADWQTKYGGVDSASMSPFNSESFGGYSYSKSGGGSADSASGSQPGTWQAAFASRLGLWRKP